VLSTVGPKGLMMLSKPLVGTAAKMVLRSKLRMHANCSVEEFEELPQPTAAVTVYQFAADASRGIGSPALNVVPD